MVTTKSFTVALQVAVLIAATSDSAMAQSPANGWSATVFFGPTTTKFVSEIILDGDFASSGSAAGLGVVRRIVYLGLGFRLAAEAQLIQGISGRADTTLSLGLGVEFTAFPWQARWPTSFSFFTGPSYSFDPPSLGGTEGHEPWFQRRPFLNYVGLELAAALNPTSKWDGVLRAFHRSGVFGLYSENADEGTFVGAGVRRRF